MAFYTDGVVPWNSLDDNTRAPLTSELEGGYPCGEADQELFNWTAGWPIGNIWNMILAAGITPDTDKLLDLARAIQNQKVNYAVPTGTANAIVATLSPVPISLASIAGMPLRLMVSTANTSTTVTLNVNGLGAKAVVYNDNTVPQPGDLNGLVELFYNPVLDKFQIMGVSRSAALNVKRSSLVADRGASSQLTGNNLATKVTGYGSLTSYFAGGSTFSSGLLTVGAADAGLWFISGHVRQTMASTSGTACSLNINGSSTPIVTDGGPISAGATCHASCSRVLNLIAGDTAEMRLLQTTGADFTFNDLYSFTAVRLGNA